MLRPTPLFRRVFSESLRRCYATAGSPTSAAHALVFVEHNNGSINPGSLSALTAAQNLGGQVSLLIVGNDKSLPGVVDQAKRFKGLSSILFSKSPQYEHSLPEVLSPLLQSLLDSSSPFTHVLSSTSSAAKSLLPRVSALLDLPTLSDVTSLSHDPATGATTFTRPIYAGNAISTVRAPGKLRIKFCTIRATSFIPATSTESESNKDIKLEEIKSVLVPDPPTEHIRTIMTKSTRPDLSTAQRVVSGGRALKNAETFEAIILPLADALNAGVGASRAAVDAGYVDNSLQVGQTGKVVAPELYVAVGISGAIQHLAGMKDSKMIVAINKDPDAPIFQVADAGLVADLYDAVPELVEKLRKA